MMYIQFNLVSLFHKSHESKATADSAQTEDSFTCSHQSLLKYYNSAMEKHDQLVPCGLGGLELS